MRKYLGILALLLGCLSFGAAPARAIPLDELALIDVVNGSSLELCQVNIWKDKRGETYNFIRGDRIHPGQTKKLIDALKPGRYHFRVTTCANLVLMDGPNYQLRAGTNQILV